MRYLKLPAAALLALAAAIFWALPAPAASTSNHPWISFEAAVNNLYQASHSSAQWAWNNTSSLVTCSSLSPCVPDGLAAASAYRFTSEATFASQVASVPAGAKVLYDIEEGNGTPANEAASPDSFMKLFNQTAVAHGLHPVITPALDLGNVATDCAKQSGEANWQWSVRCNLWGHSVAGSQGQANSIIQGQTLTTNLANYDSLWSQGSAEILAWFSSPKAKPGDELSGNYGTAAQQTAAAQSIPSAYDMYFSFSSTQTSDVITVFASLQSSGW